MVDDGHMDFWYCCIRYVKDLGMIMTDSNLKQILKTFQSLDRRVTRLERYAQQQIRNSQRCPFNPVLPVCADGCNGCGNG